MEHLRQERQWREHEKKEASLSQQTKWLFDQAREYHALRDLSSCQLYEEDEVMAGEYPQKHVPERLVLTYVDLSRTTRGRPT